ncbi:MULTISPECIES: (2Fe-2S)-binding protein [Pseudonocardia]|uniref:Ferric siderophore reductase C-terminal domain-containing protein n=2 Tax=Pseudonocardia TaxID=1847 RepID=A0A1Y2MKV8_PSEAH|nr:MULTISPECIES: (2Fe-2S)-binding protein [Pseudonocardia]OSY35916.1 hypothetical protein BG845_05754 [Pseudonocardia autotrophica]TDN73976.1 FhuF-like iron-sulfur protein [Pseudonocardia autotrophica]BBG04730.1 hypothetical protein Pdca_59390 [Pseudonocardia autotrophica]GEC28921.1 hypothetical protein PSA01_59500 [Pseudonocardia saturnea]
MIGSGDSLVGAPPDGPDTAQPSMQPSISRVLADLAAVGPFFELRDVVAERAEGRVVRPCTALLGELDERIERTRVALDAHGRLGRRIAASITAQGLAAKLVSGPVAAMAMHDVAVDTTRATVWWSATPAGDVVALDPVRFVPSRDTVARFPVVDEILVPLVEAIHDGFGVSPTVLWGNVASSVAGAKRVLDIQRPDLARQVADAAADMLAHPRLSEEGERRDPVAPDQLWTYRRRSCCLYYRLPGGNVCADCVLQNRWSDH